MYIILRIYWLIIFKTNFYTQVTHLVGSLMHKKSNIQITVSKAGRRGGQTTLKNQGNDFFRRIGKKGGKRTAELYRDLLSEFGKKGGRPRRPTLSEYMEEEDR
jgi:general stress protein YciG